MQQAKMKIEGMHCGSCAIDIKETLEERAAFVMRRLITMEKPRSSNLTKIWFTVISYQLWNLSLIT